MAVVLVDVQEKLLAAYSEEVKSRLINRSLLAIKSAAALNVPVVVTEQYPQGLGNTIPAIAGALPQGVRIIEKKSFSCFGEPLFVEAINRLGVKSICVLGVETHVCVQQTVLDAIDRGLGAALLADATDSRSQFDKETAIRLMIHQGATVTTAESLVFTLMESATHPAFKTVSKLVKELFL